MRDLAGQEKALGWPWHAADAHDGLETCALSTACYGRCPAGSGGPCRAIAAPGAGAPAV